MKLIEIRTKCYIALIIFIFILTQAVYGQQANKADTYFRIEGDGLLANQLKATVKEKQTTVYTIAGFVNIYRTPALNASANQLYYRKYFKGDTLKNYLKRSITEKNNVEREVSLVYLSPNQEFIIEVLDRKTDTLVSSYIVKRLKLIPTIQLKSKQGTNIWTFGPHVQELKLSPGQNLTLAMIKPADFKDLEVSYSLTNLKTKKTEHKTSKNDFESLALTANTTYELRVNYTLQPESVGVGYIQVKPYLYQSSYTYIVLFVVLAGLGFLFITLVLKKKINLSQNKQRKMEEAAIRLQSLLNPHFTFNALSAIQGLMNTDRIDEANHYLQEFSALLRQTLAKSKNVFNSLDQELEMMRMYLRLEALRFDFSWHIEVDPSLTPSVIDIPTLLLQPLVENAIKHGLPGLNGKGQLLISCTEGQKKDTFVITVKDNGTWVDKGEPIGYGLSLTAERIKTINKMKKDQSIELRINKEEGTAVVLTFHNWINN